MKRLLAALALLGALACPAIAADHVELPQIRVPAPQAQEPRQAWHNGSLMDVLSLPDGSIELRYAQPRPALWALGVRPGTLLVKGWWHEGVFDGTAFVYSYCGAWPYHVTGIATGGHMELNGPAPYVAQGIFECYVWAYVWNENSHLVFDQAG